MSRLAFVLVLCSILPSPVGAQETYRTPPAIVQHVLDAPRLPMLSTAPDGKRLLFAAYQGMVTIADLAQPMLRLGGLRGFDARGEPTDCAAGRDAHRGHPVVA